MARFDRDVLGTHAACAGGGEQAESTRAHYRDPLPRPAPGEAHGVPGNRRRLHDRRVAQLEARRQRDEARGRRTELFRHATVGGDAEGALAVRRAQVVRAAQALRALHASVQRLDHDLGAILSDARELMAEDHAAAEADVEQVRRAHTRRPHLEELPRSRRFLELHDVNATFRATYGLHRFLHGFENDRVAT